MAVVLTILVLWLLYYWCKEAKKARIEGEEEIIRFVENPELMQWHKEHAKPHFHKEMQEVYLAIKKEREKREKKRNRLSSS